MAVRWWHVALWLLAGAASAWLGWVLLGVSSLNLAAWVVFVIAGLPVFVLGLAWLLTGFRRARPARRPVIAVVGLLCGLWVYVLVVGTFFSDH